MSRHARGSAELYDIIRCNELLVAEPVAARQFAAFCFFGLLGRGACGARGLPWLGALRVQDNVSAGCSLKVFGHKVSTNLRFHC